MITWLLIGIAVAAAVAWYYGYISITLNKDGYSSCYNDPVAYMQKTGQVFTGSSPCK